MTDDPAALMLEAIRCLGLRYQQHPENLRKWKADCPICRQWSLLVFENGDKLTAGLRAAATCENECDRVGILRAFADVLAQNEAHDDLPAKRAAYMARLGVIDTTEPDDTSLLSSLQGGRAFSVYLLPEHVAELESARERVELEMKRLGDPYDLRLEDVLVAAAQAGLTAMRAQAAA